PVPDGSRQKGAAENERPEPGGAPHIAEHLNDVPQVGGRVTFRPQDLLAVLLEQITRNGVLVGSWQSQPQQRIRPGGWAHVRPRSGHDRPSHNDSTAARASLSARIPAACTR